MCNEAAIQKIFVAYAISLAIYFAADKPVAEPLKYFRNNLDSLLTVLAYMQHTGGSKIVFSSSVTVHDQLEQLPITEETPFQKALSAYGSNKQMSKEILGKVSMTGLV